MKCSTRHATALVAALAVATPALADGAAQDRIRKGLQLLQEGGALLMQGLAESAEPTLEEVLRQLDDLSAYDAPVILPNGDILIRRKRPRDNATGDPETGGGPPGGNALPEDAPGAGAGDGGGSGKADDAPAPQDTRPAPDTGTTEL